MKTGLITLALLSGLSWAAQAQQAAPSSAAASSGVQTSTDPARAAAVEKQALDMSARGSQPKVFFRGATDSGLTILSGGSTVGDRVTMHAEKSAYSLWVATVARPSGAYLADAKLRIVNLGDKSVALERTMEGPWLMAALPAGKYEISATYKAAAGSSAHTLSNRVTVPKSGQRQVVLRFDTNDTVASDMDRPFKGNPFGMPAIKK